jgi:hypothetical protein
VVVLTAHTIEKNVKKEIREDLVIKYPTPYYFQNQGSTPFIAVCERIHLTNQGELTVFYEKWIGLLAHIKINRKFY